MKPRKTLTTTHKVRSHTHHTKQNKTLAGNSSSGDRRSPDSDETDARKKPQGVVAGMMGSCICPLETPARLLWTTSFFRHKLMIF
ncbi:hypothetical protein RJT34_27784 [Clitoria ternatea]|uniref:Uncharacterized protein n=1 Tax=Clitoria ternatea TaxID=43366 RepID=A0AAN9FAD8_CLITE